MVSEGMLLAFVTKSSFINTKEHTGIMTGEREAAPCRAITGLE